MGRKADREEEAKTHFDLPCRKDAERELKAAERRLHDDNDRLTSEVARLKKEIEEKLAEKYRAIEEAKADGDERVRPVHSLGAITWTKSKCSKLFLVFSSDFLSKKAFKLRSFLFLELVMKVSCPLQLLEGANLLFFSSFCSVPCVRA